VHVPAMATKVPDSFFGAFGRIGDEYLKALYRFAEANGIPVVHSRRARTKRK
jgi:hypothetical protein